MSYWKRMFSGEQGNVLQYWINDEDHEEVIIFDTTESSEHKANYGAFTSDKERIGTYIEPSEVVFHLYEEKDLLLEGSVWSDGDKTFEIVDRYPETRSTRHSYYPEDTDSNVVYVEHIDSGKSDWVKEELFTNSLELVDAGM